MYYKKFRETTRVKIFADSFVRVSWHPRNKKRYESMGYKFSGMGVEFSCSVNDLSHGTTVPVLAICPLCGKESTNSFSVIHKAGHTLCQPCANTIDLRGERFGRWLVTDINLSNESPGAEWVCLCDCGTISTVKSGALLNGGSKSCGCYTIDSSKARVGSKSPTWKGGEVSLVCEFCGERYKTKRGRKNTSKFCSRSCLSMWQSRNKSGMNSPRWNFNLTHTERKLGRSIPGNRFWKTSVLKRDSYTCQTCGRREFLHVHHLYSYANNKNVRQELNNGITLCSCCHINFHSWMGGSSIPCSPVDFLVWASCTDYVTIDLTTRKRIEYLYERKNTISQTN